MKSVRIPFDRCPEVWVAAPHCANANTFALPEEACCMLAEMNVHEIPRGQDGRRKRYCFHGDNDVSGFKQATNIEKKTRNASDWARIDLTFSNRFFIFAR